MVSAIWLAMQNTSCMGISGRALSKVTVLVAGRARPGGTHRVSPWGCDHTSALPCPCSEPCRCHRGTLCSAPGPGVPGTSGPSRGAQLQILARLQHHRAISFIEKPRVWLPKLPDSLGEHSSWELHVLLGFFSWEKRGNKVGDRVNTPLFRSTHCLKCKL